MVREAIAITAVLLVSLVPAPAHAAPAGCLEVDLASFAEVAHAGPLAGAAGWDRATGFSKERLPMVPTVLAVRGETACDLTHGLALFLGERAAPLRADEALDLALFAVGAIFVDVLPDARLAEGISDLARPTVLTPLERGYLAQMSVWTPRNGVVADVRVVMDGAIDATFVVRESAVGPFVGDVEGWNLQPGMTDRTVSGDVGAMATKVLMGTNADGKQWRITYYTQNYASEALADYHAQMHMSGALAAYANGTSWGLVSTDPDGILDLTLDGCDCIYSGHQANIHMFPRANDILPLLPGLNYRAEEETAELIVGHELFHHFQYGIMQWRHGGWLLEGMARFSETVNVPDFTFLPTTLTYWPNLNGMNGFLLSPSGTITTHSYDWSIVWGYLYAHEGGMPFIVRALRESATGGTNGNVDGPAAIQRAMDAVPGGEHATFAAAYADFARAAVTKTGFVWGAPDGTQVHDWATYFVSIARDNGLFGTVTAQPWGIRVHHAAPGPSGSSIVAFSDAVGVTGLLYTRAGATSTFTDATVVNPVSGANDAALVIVRTSNPANPSDPTAQYQYAIVR